jgi:hypothetical protein
MTTLEMPDDVEAEESLAAQAEGSDPSRSPAVARATRPTPRLNGAQKVAIVLAQLGPQRAAAILRSMSDAEAISLTTELANLPPLDQETVASVLAPRRSSGRSPASSPSGRWRCWQTRTPVRW